MKKRSASTATATATTTTIFVVLFIIFLIRQITFSSIWSSSSIASTTTVQGNQIDVLKLRHEQVLPSTQSSVSSSEPIRCDHSHYRYDLCIVNSSTVVNPTTSTVFLVDPIESIPSQKIKVRPYPRKWENNIMSLIKELTLTTAPYNTRCDVHHNSPALVFSTGGYTGNLFHDFNDGIIPLFVTIRSFFPDRDPVLVIANCRNWWLSKYAEVIQQFTPYPIINLDTETVSHCFPSATIGIITHGDMTIDPKSLPHSETFHNFRALLGKAYSHTNHHFSRSTSWKPRILLVSRTGDVGRVIKNQVDVVKVAEKIGFEVALFEPTKYTSLSNAYGLINSSHVMLGVHGAALTHFLFLRPGSVFIQVVPIGVDSLAETCFGKPANDIGVDYMEYKIRAQESSLVEKYGMDHLVLNPNPFSNRSFADFKNIYLKSQDVTLDLDRIGRYLKRAYKKAKRFMDINKDHK